MKAWHILIAMLLCIAMFFIGWYTKPALEPIVKYIELPPIVIEKNASDLRPISAVIPDSIVYVTKYRDEPESAEPSPPGGPSQPVIDTLASYLATVEDWNIKREYADTLFDSDTLGTATIREVVQYNRLVERNFHYEPRQKTVTSVVPPPVRLQPYALTNITTQWTSVGVGLKYGKIGVHIIGGYDYKSENPSIGGGLLVVF